MLALQSAERAERQQAMTEKTHQLIEAYRLFKVGGTETLVKHIDHLEACAAFVRRLAKEPCDLQWIGEFGEDQTCKDGAAEWCWPCQARNIVRRTGKKP